MFIKKPALVNLEVFPSSRSSTLDTLLITDEIRVVFWLDDFIFIRLAGGKGFTGRLFIESGTIPGKAGTA
jgi:hypothetical protein